MFVKLVWIVLGGIAGLFFGAGGHELLAFVAGAVIAWLVSEQRALAAKLRQLELRSRAGPAPEAAPPWSEPAPEARPAESPLRDAPPVEPAVPEASAAAAMAPDPASFAAGDRKPGTAEKLLGMAKNWLTTGNVPVKLGVIVSFFGVAFLLRYAVDQRLIVISIEARYLAVTAIAGALLATGWRLRQRLPVYALSMQGGGIGILYLTLFAAFRLHGLLPAPFAFGLLVALTAAAGVLAVMQNAMSLAVLGTVGGFLAPVLVSTGSGNHVALFSYYLLLNAAVLGIAWYRPWRVLNVLGFLFTFGVAILWGNEYYRPALFASTEPFLIAFFLFYQAIAILFAFRQPPRLRGFVDGTLVFGTPVVAFALQSELVGDTEYGLAISATVLAIFYTLVAVWLHGRRIAAMRMLIESFIALGVAFATVAIPLALDDRWTAAAWSLEGAALVWVGVRQRRPLAKLAGTGLLIAAGVAFVEYGWTGGESLPLLNGNFLGGVLISLASLFAAHYLAADGRPHRGQALLSAPLLVWGLLWWGGTGGGEIVDQVESSNQLHVLTAFIALSVAALALLGRHFDWTAARRATLAYLPLLPVVAILYFFEHRHLFAGVGTLSWLLAALAHFGLLRAYDNGKGRLEGLWHFAGAIFLTAVVAAEVRWRLDATELNDTWAITGLLLVPAFAAFGIVQLRKRLAWPLERYSTAYLAAAGVLIGAQLISLVSLGIDDPGDPRPLPYVPLLNPLDVLTIVGLAVALHFIVVLQSARRWLGQGGFRAVIALWTAAAFLLTTIAVVRGVHHLGDVPWRDQALMNSVSVQSALSIYWAILGFGGMVFGARNGRRAIWIAGTGLMALVVVKLFLVDLGNTGTVARIVSFLGVGALLLVVGYYAPAPPRLATERED